jgi:hypothetical protein
MDPGVDQRGPDRGLASVPGQAKADGRVVSLRDQALPLLAAIIVLAVRAIQIALGAG